MTEAAHTDEAKPKRLSLSQVLELVLTKPSRSHPSVTISTTAAGVTTWAIDVPAGEGETAEDAEALAVAIHERMMERFPPTGHHDQAEVTSTRNAKGETQVSASGKTNAETPTLEALDAKVRKVYDSARMKYPMADGHSAKPGSVK